VKMMFDAALIARTIKAAGIKRAFGILGGGRSLDLVTALIEEEVTYHPVHFEGSAAIMAGVTGLLTENVGLALAIKGPGIANMIPGLTACRFENFPMVALTEAYEKVSGDAVPMHKRLDHQALTGEVVKGSGFCGVGEETINEAIALAKKEAPGPVHLDLVEHGQDNLSESFENQDLSNSQIPINEILRKIEDSRRPTLIVGSLGIRLDISEEIHEIRVPVFSTLAAKGVLDERTDYSAGVYTGAASPNLPERTVLQKSDLIIGIGLRSSEILKHPIQVEKITNLELPGLEHKLTGNWETTFGVRRQIVQVLKALREREWGSEQLDRARSEASLLFDQAPFLPADVYRTLQGNLPDNSRFVVDTGNFCTIAEHLLLAKFPHQTLFSANSRYMGTALPMGVAASLHETSTPVIVICGDGGIGMFIGEIRLAIENKLPLLLILMTDGAYASILGKAKRSGLNESVLKLRNPSWVNAMEGLGLPSTEISSEEDLTLGLREINLKNGPHFIECRFDPHLYLRMTEKVRN
jgi:acetolactate synthase I/II/III large subunit